VERKTNPILTQCTHTPHTGTQACKATTPPSPSGPCPRSPPRQAPRKRQPRNVSAACARGVLRVLCTRRPTPSQPPPHTQTHAQMTGPHAGTGKQEEEANGVLAERSFTPLSLCLASPCAQSSTSFSSSACSFPLPASRPACISSPLLCLINVLATLPLVSARPPLTPTLAHPGLPPAQGPCLSLSAHATYHTPLLTLHPPTFPCLSLLSSPLPCHSTCNTVLGLAYTPLSLSHPL